MTFKVGDYVKLKKNSNKSNWSIQGKTLKLHLEAIWQITKINLKEKRQIHLHTDNLIFDDGSEFLGWDMSYKFLLKHFRKATKEEICLEEL